MLPIQKWLAAVGTAFCIAGLVFGWFVLFNIDPFKWGGLEQMPIIGGERAIYDGVMSILLWIGALNLALVAKIGKNKLFFFLEFALLIWGALSFVAHPYIMWPIRCIVLIGTWYYLYKTFGKEVLRREFFGCAGIEVLSLGYFTGRFEFFFVGGVLLCIYSVQGMRSEDSSTRQISTFWLYLNLLFSLFAAVGVYVVWTR